MKFLIISSALLCFISIFISPQFAIFPLVPLILYLNDIKLKPPITASLLLASLFFDNPIVYGSVLELTLLSW